MKPIQDIIERILAIMGDEQQDNTLFLIECTNADTWIVSAIDKQGLTTISVAESDTLYSAFEMLAEIINEDEQTIH